MSKCKNCGTNRIKGDGEIYFCLQCRYYMSETDQDIAAREYYQDQITSLREQLAMTETELLTSQRKQYEEYRLEWANLVAKKTAELREKDAEIERLKAEIPHLREEQRRTNMMNSK